MLYRVVSDHCSFVLQDLTLKHGWRTGAIIPELRKEIKIMNTEQYMHMMAWLQALTGLIEQMQVRRLHIKTFVSFPLCLYPQMYVLHFFVLRPNRSTGIQNLKLS